MGRLVSHFPLSLCLLVSADPTRQRVVLLSIEVMPPSLMLIVGHTQRRSSRLISALKAQRSACRASS